MRYEDMTPEQKQEYGFFKLHPEFVARITAEQKPDGRGRPSKQLKDAQKVVQMTRLRRKARRRKRGGAK